MFPLTARQRANAYYSTGHLRIGSPLHLVPLSRRSAANKAKKKLIREQQQIVSLQITS